jgi:hypothetical protein
MNDDSLNEHPGLLDDEDPALDFILYKEMEKEDRRHDRKPKQGCLGLLLLVFLPAGIGLWVIRMAV